MSIVISIIKVKMVEGRVVVEGTATKGENLININRSFPMNITKDSIMRILKSVVKKEFSKDDSSKFNELKTLEGTQIEVVD